MAVRRTFKQKQQAAVRREQHVSYSLPLETTAPGAIPQAQPTVSHSPSSLLLYDWNLMRRDWLKTLVVLAIVLACLGGWWWYLQ